MNRINGMVVTAVVACVSLSAGMLHALDFPQLPGASYVGLDAAANSQVARTTGYLYNPSSAVANVVGAIPCAENNPLAHPTFYIRNNNGSTYSVQAYAMNVSTKSVAFQNSNTSQGGDNSLSPYFLLVTGVHYFYSALVMLPAASGLKQTRLYGVECI